MACISPENRRPLWTANELQQNAVALIGNLDEGDYDFFLQRMQQIAEIQGICMPRLAISAKFIGSPLSQACSVTRAEWNVLKNAGEQMWESYKPLVFVVDGSRFSLPF